MFIESSAKAGHNVKTLFRKIAQALPGMEREGEAAAGANQSESFFLIPLSISPSLCRVGEALMCDDTVIDVSVTPTNTTAGEEGKCAC